MRWFDIILPEPGTDQALDRGLAEAAALAARYPAGAAARRSGRAQPAAAHGTDRSLPLRGPDPGRAARLRPHAARRPPSTRRPSAKRPTTPSPASTWWSTPAWLGLPWNWLHNGLNFVLEQHPLCASLRPAALPPERARRPWMQRQVRAGFLVGDGGAQDLRVRARPVAVARRPPAGTAVHPRAHRPADAPPDLPRSRDDRRSPRRRRGRPPARAPGSAGRRRDAPACSATRTWPTRSCTSPARSARRRGTTTRSASTG